MDYNFTNASFKHYRGKKGNSTLIVLSILLVLFLALQFMKFIDQPDRMQCLDAKDVNSGSQRYHMYYVDCKAHRLHT
jgi:hypothetical protein